MIIKEEVKKILPFKNLENIFVVADFDRTITDGSSKTSWAILASSKLVSPSYEQERNELYKKYQPIEVDNSLPLDYRMKMVEEWFKKHFELIINYKIKEEIFYKAAASPEIMKFRTGAKEFIEYLYQNNIPLVIISAGIGNFIEEFLKLNNCYYDNIYICSNKIIFEDGVATRLSQNIIHSLNKNEVTLPLFVKEKLKNRKNVILLGDQVSDINMVDESKHNLVLKVGFLSCNDDKQLEALESNFDIVCKEDDDYNKLKDLLF